MTGTEPLTWISAIWSHPDQLELIPGAAEAIRALNNSGFTVVVISNQAGIAKGLIQEDKLPEIQNKFIKMLEEKGAKIDGFYYCPHHPEGSVKKHAGLCNCRKPEPDFCSELQKIWTLIFPKHMLCGDKLTDVQLAHNVGAVGIMF